MKKANYLWTIVMIAITACILTFGVVALILRANIVYNDIIFDRGDENVFVDINAYYHGPKLEEGKDSSFSYSIEDDFEGSYDVQQSTRKWDLGHIEFTTAEPQIDFVFEITNTNGVNALKLDIKGIAYDKDARFVTSYSLLIENDEDVVDPETQKDNEVLSAEEIKGIEIDSNQTCKITITYKLVNFSKDVDYFRNNLNLSLNTIYEK